MPALSAVLSPFRRRYAGSQSAYDCVAFIHCFGVTGPSPAAWHALFSSSTGLRAEEVAILVAHAATGGEGKGDPAERRAVMSEVVLGGIGVPGILEKVCNLFDEWVLSVEALHGMLAARAADVADRWRLARISEGRFMWICGRTAEVGTAVDEHALGDAMAVCAQRIGVSVAKEVVEEAVRRVSSEGVQRAIERVRERAEMFAGVASGRAEGVLIGKVFQALELQQPVICPWQ